MIGAAALDEFLSGQLQSWQFAANNFKALQTVRVKSFEVDSFVVKAQFNPARIVSSSAKIDAKSISQRKCFLCDANRPVEQQSRELGRYKILVNPYPIFRKHFTIPSAEHTAQRIAGRMAEMAEMACKFAGYTVFYNGPKCGASAPDHAHFQAIETEMLSLPQAVIDSQDISIKPGLTYVNSLPLKVFHISASTPAQAADIFNELYAAMPIADGEDEPMMNVLCFATNGEVHIVVIPRKRHRPSFYGTDSNQMLLSPASVDMGGTFIMPVEKDFERIDADVVRRVYDEVCLSDNEMQLIISNIKQ